MGGEVQAVVVANLRLGNGNTLFDSALHDGADDSIMLFREVDGYTQFLSEEGVGPAEYTEIQTPLDERAENRRMFEAYLGLTVEEIKQSKEPVVIRTSRSGESLITAARFNPRYELWTVSETGFVPVHQEFSASLVRYLGLYVLVSLVLWKWFRVIDQSEQKRRHELFYLSRHDDLTGLLNRTGLLDRLKTLVKAQKPFTLIVINIDNFKGINDRFGLPIGDKALIAFGRRLAELVERRDDLARLGGDEFAIVTPNVNLKAVEKACAGIKAALAKSIEVQRFQLQITASMGVATFPEHGDSVSLIIRSAHLAQYEAKDSRDSVSVYRDEMEMAYLRRLSVEQRLRQGLEAGSLFMVYQPQVDESANIVGLEALVRWQDEELGFVSPAEFVEVAEQTGLMFQLGQFVLDTSVREYRRLRAGIGHPLDLAINISVIQFRQPGFVEAVMKTIQANEVPPQALVLEITETLFINDIEPVLNTIRKLQELGIRISMDDFGTGYSSLSLLRRLHLDELKIDKSFVDNILDDSKAYSMIESIIAIAGSHKMALVAEGVEDKAQGEALIAMGCRRLQGYYFYRPIRMDELREHLAIAGA